LFSRATDVPEDDQHLPRKAVRRRFGEMALVKKWVVHPKDWETPATLNDR
jgi:hypothetical protein